VGRIESSVTSISWIPSEAIEGLPKLPFEIGVAHYDEPPPDLLDDLEALRSADRFRFANELRAWIEVDHGTIVGHGHIGSGHIGSTTVRMVGRDILFQAVSLPDIRREQDVSSERVRFVQTAGGRTGLPAPRRVRRRPFVQMVAPIAWTTLSLTIHADGHSEFEVGGASPFPRHWVYDERGELAAKTGVVNFDSWYRESFGAKTPWGAEDSPAVVTAAETALERELSRTIMRAKAAPHRRRLKAGEALVQQGEQGREVFLLLDGVLSVEVDDKPLTEIGPGAIVGERALLEGGRRTSTLRAVTDCRVAVMPEDQIDIDHLRAISAGHRREDSSPRDA
jgi:Cyclic nucleotide-binding domain